jgi:hypothetical protein
MVVEKIAPPKFAAEVLVNGELPEETQAELLRRCNNIYGMFKDPVRHADIIKTRLHNIGLTLPPYQRKFVEDWTERQLKADNAL